MFPVFPIPRHWPKCWATSNTSLGDLSLTSRAFRMGGRPSSNCTSTTAPITATILPWAPDLAAAAGSLGAAALAYHLLFQPNGRNNTFIFARGMCTAAASAHPMRQWRVEASSAPVWMIGLLCRLRKQNQQACETWQPFCWLFFSKQGWTWSYCAT